jgi:hypothetical protein
MDKTSRTGQDPTLGFNTEFQRRRLIAGVAAIGEQDHKMAFSYFFLWF